MTRMTTTKNSILGMTGLTVFLVAVYFIPLGETVQNTLMCYQCTIQGNNESICDSDYKLCPNDQAYDRCMINIVRNTTTGEFIIRKRCALAPCEFEESVEKTLGFTDKCILSRRDPDCVKCCSGNGCNKRTSQSIADQLSTGNSRTIENNLLALTTLLGSFLYHSSKFVS